MTRGAVSVFLRFYADSFSYFTFELSFEGDCYQPVLFLLLRRAELVICKPTERKDSVSV